MANSSCLEEMSAGGELAEEGAEDGDDVWVGAEPERTVLVSAAPVDAEAEEEDLVAAVEVAKTIPSVDTTV